MAALFTIAILIAKTTERASYVPANFEWMLSYSLLLSRSPVK